MCNSDSKGEGLNDIANSECLCLHVCVEAQTFNLGGKGKYNFLHLKRFNLEKAKTCI